MMDNCLCFFTSILLPISFCKSTFICLVLFFCSSFFLTIVGSFLACLFCFCLFFPVVCSFVFKQHVFFVLSQKGHPNGSFSLGSTKYNTLECQKNGWKPYIFASNFWRLTSLDIIMQVCFCNSVKQCCVERMLSVVYLNGGLCFIFWLLISIGTS